MTLHIYDMPQRSEEWFEARRGIVTASAIGKLITVRKLGALDFACPACEAPANDQCKSKRDSAPILKPHPERTAVSASNKTRVVEVASNEDSRALTAALAAERINGFTDPTWMNNDMMRGVYDEPLARDLYAKHYGVLVEEVGFLVRDFGTFKIGLSPDGLVPPDGGIEIKSRRTGRQLQTVLADTVPIENVAQIQTALLVTGRDWWDYVSFAGGMSLYVKRVYPDQRWQQVIVEAARICEENIREQMRLYAEMTAGMPVAERVNYDLDWWCDMGSRIECFTVEGVQLDLFISDCANCGVIFGIPSALEERRRNDRKPFYCPNGHNLVFTGPSEAEKRAKLERERADRLRVQLLAAQDQTHAAEREAAEAKASEIRLRWRVGNGVCPCCHRTFPGLAAHVAKKHPEFVHQDVATLSTRMRELLAAIYRQTEEQDAAVLDAREIGAHMGTVRSLANRGLVETLDYYRVALTEAGWPMAEQVVAEGV